MGPAEGQAHVALLRQGAVAGVAVDLQHALEAAEMGYGPLGLAVGGIDVGHARRLWAAPGPVITGVGPELARLGPSAPGIEHRRRGLVGEELLRRLEPHEQTGMHGAEQPGGTSNPIRQSRAVELHALAAVDLGLPVEREMVCVLAHDDVGDRRFRWQAALDQPRRRRGLHYALLAGATGVLGPAGDQHPELGGDDVQPLGDILTDAVQLARAAGACLALDIDHHLHAGQVRRQGAPVGAALLSLLRAGRGVGLLRLSGGRSLSLLYVLQAQLELVQRQGLRTATEAVALQLLDDLGQAVGPDALGQEHRLQRLHIVWKSVRQAVHARNKSRPWGFEAPPRAL